MARVFVSYSRRDEEFVVRLARALEAQGIEVSRDVDDLLPAAEWAKQLEQMVSAADTVVFVISPDSVASQTCTWEISLVERLNKRLAPIVYRPVADDKVPQGIAKLHYVFFTQESAFDSSVAALVSAIDTDIGWLSEHTRIAALSHRWAADGRRRTDVLRGAALEAAEQWLRLQPKAAPQPTAQQREFISFSRSDATQRQRYWIFGSSLAAVVAIILAGLAFWQKLQADEQRAAAESNREQAVTAQSLAESNQRRAEQSQKEAEEQRQAAQDNLAGQSRLLAQLSEEQTRAGDSELAIDLALQALPRDLEKKDRTLVPEALVALHFAVDQNRRQMTLAGHARSVMFGMFSPDGASVLTASADQTARLWNRKTGELVRELTGGDDAVIFGAFSADGRKLATTSGPLVRVWNGNTGEPVLILQGHQKNVQRIAFTPDGSRIVTGSWDNSARIWNAMTGELLHVLQAPAWSRNPSATGFGAADPVVQAVLAASHQIFGGSEMVAVSPDGKMVATAGQYDAEAAIRLWDVESGRLVRALRGPRIALGSQYHDIAFSPDGSRLAGAGGDKAVRVWHTATGDQILALTDHTGDVQSVRFSADGRRLVSGSMDGSARIWDSGSGRMLTALHGHKGWVNSAEFSPDGRLVLTVSSDRGVRLWDADTGTQVANLVGHRDWVLSGRFSTDGGQIVTTSRDATARIWLTHIGEARMGLEAIDIAGSDSLSSSPRERIAVTAQNGQRIYVTDSLSRRGKLVSARTGAVVSEVEGQDGLFFDNGRLLLTFAEDGGALRVWNADDGRLVHTLDGRGIRFDASRSVLVSSSGGSVLVTDPVSGKEVARLDPKLGDIEHALTTKHGARVVVSGTGGFALWSATDQRLVRLLEDLGGVPSEVLLSPDEKYVAAITKSGRIGLWSVEDGRTVALQRDPREEFSAIEFSPAGTLLRGTRQDGSLHLWRARDGGSLLSLSRVAFAGSVPAGSDHVEITRSQPARETGERLELTPSSDQASSWSRGSSIGAQFLGEALVLGTRSEILIAESQGLRRLAIASVGCEGSLASVTIGLVATRLALQLAGDKPVTCMLDLERGSSTLLAGTGVHSYGSSFLLDTAGKLAIRLDEGGATLWDTTVARPLATLPRNKSDGNEKATSVFDRRSERAVMVVDGVAHLMDAQSGKSLAVLNRTGNQVNSIAIDDAAGLVLTFHSNGEMSLWRLVDGTFIGAVPHPEREVETGQRSRRRDNGDETKDGIWRLLDGGRLLLGGQRGLWDTASGKLLRRDTVDADQQGQRLLVSPLDEAGKPIGDAGMKVVDRHDGRTLLDLGNAKSERRSDYDRDKGPFVHHGTGLVAVADDDRVVRLWRIADGKLHAALANHEAAIETVAFNRGGDHIATGTRDRVVNVWRAPFEKPVVVFGNLPEAPRQIVFSPPGDRLAVLLHSGRTLLWNTANWQAIELAQSTLPDAKSIEFDAAGELLLLTAGDRKARLWNATDGTHVVDVAPAGWQPLRFSSTGTWLIDDRQSGMEDLIDARTGLPLKLGEGEKLKASDGRHVVVSSKQFLSVRRLPGGDEVGRLEIAADEIERVQLSPDGSVVAIAKVNGVLLLTTVTGDAMRQVSTPFGQPRIDFTPDGRNVLVYGSSSAAHVIDAGSGALVHVLPDHAGRIENVSVSESGRLLLVTAGDTTTIWRREEGQRIGTATSASYASKRVIVETPGGLRAIVPTYDKPQLWDPVANTLLATLKEEKEEEPASRSSVFSSSGDGLTAISPDGRWIAQVRGDALGCWNIDDGRNTGSAQHKVDEIKRLVPIGGNRFAALAGNDNLLLWDAASCKRFAELRHALSGVGKVVPIPGGEVLLTLPPTDSGSRDVPANPYLWNARDGRRIAELNGHTSEVSIVRSSPDGRYVLTSASGVGWLWRTDNGVFTSAIGQHSDTITLAEFSPDGKRIATAAREGTIQIWDVAEARKIAELQADGTEATVLAFSNDGRHLAIARLGGRLEVYDAAANRLLMARRGTGAQILRLQFPLEPHQVLVQYEGGETARHVVSPGGFSKPPSAQALIDFASIFSGNASLAQAPRPAVQLPAQAPADQDAAIVRCHQLAADPADSDRQASPVADDAMNTAPAVEACQAAIELRPDDKLLRHQLARALRAKGDAQTAMTLMRQSAEAGHAASMLRLGLWLAAASSKSGEKDEVTQAQGWIRDAADKGNAEAQNIIGLALWSDARDDGARKEAIAMMRRAADAGSPLAHENLAMICGFWLNDIEAVSEQLVHLLRASRLYGQLGRQEKSALLLNRAQVLAGVMGADRAAQAVRIASQTRP